MVVVMTAPKRISFGDDGSAGADVAWGWLVAQSWPDWRVDVITVKSLTPDSYKHDAIEFELHPWQPDKPREAPTSADAFELVNLTVESDPRVVLGECHSSAFVLVGQRGKGLLKAMRLGSTVEWLMRCPGAPLLIAKNAKPVRKILVAVDGSVHADAAAALLAQLPFVSGAQVTVLGIVEADNDIRAKIAAAGELLEKAGADVTEVVAEQDPLVLTVSPRMTITDYLQSEKTDLVVMGTRGMTGLPRLWVGSVASAVAHHADCSVLLARAAD
jgi:nucleotide-binding universal stress UspA family protein